MGKDKSTSTPGTCLHGVLGFWSAHGSDDIGRERSDEQVKSVAMSFVKGLSYLFACLEESFSKGWDGIGGEGKGNF